MPNAKLIAKFKKQLISQQVELRELEQTGDDASKTVELDQTRVGRLSRMDALQGQAMSLEMKRRRQLELKNIAAALRRIENNEYGYCVKCDEEIATKRLEFDPAAALCIECANKTE